MLQRSGVLQGTSRQVLAALGDARYWLEVIGKLEDDYDYRTIAAIMQFHQSMRDGRPAQQVNLTSFNLSVSADDIAQARQIVRELRGEVSPPVLEQTESESADDPNMLLDAEGENLGGVG